MRSESLATELALPRTIVRGETRWRRWRRRAISIPAVFLAFVVVLASAPVWAPLAFVADALRGFRTALLRSGLFLVLYLLCEIGGVLASVALSLTTRRTGPDGRPNEAWFERHFALQRWWSGTLMAGVERLFRVRFRAEGLEHLDQPMILLLAHSSIADTLLASRFVSNPHRIHLRYVLKRELLVDPCLDIVGHRLPNYFVDRESDQPQDVLADVRRLLTGLRSNEGVLIYPEGTRFGETKRRRILERLEGRGDERAAARARALRHTLPPRLGGTLALLRANPGLPVVIGAHTGFEPVARPADLLGRSILDAEVELHFWRIPAEEIPVDPQAQVAWLFEQWSRVDRWIGERRRDQASSR